MNRQWNKFYFFFVFVFWFKRVLDRGREQRESNLTVLCQLIIIILISYILMYYIIMKLLIVENHPSRNRKRNSRLIFVFVFVSRNLFCPTMHRVISESGSQNNYSWSPATRGELLLWLVPGKSYWEGRLSTVDLLLLSKV